MPPRYAMRALDDRLRELAPAVKLSRENITLVTRYQHVAMGLRDWKIFSSTSRPWQSRLGLGIHACVGRVLAGLEADALLGALARHIRSFQPAGEPEPWMTAIGRGPEKLPLRFTAQ